MTKKYIIQLKRRYFYEDLLKFHDFKTAYAYFCKLKNDGMQVRLLEVWFL